MAEPKTKRERKRAAAQSRDADQAAGAGKAARAQTKAERRQARAGRKRAGSVEAAGRSAGRDEIEARLARIEDAVASQAERSEALMAKVDEVLREARKSARHAKGAVERSAD